MINQEKLETELKIAVRDYSFSDEAKALYYMQPGSGLIHPCALRAVAKFITPLLEEIELLKKQAGLKVTA